MKKDGKYRYSLQFGMSSEEEIRAGELLESLGNKKSKTAAGGYGSCVKRRLTMRRF